MYFFVNLKIYIYNFFKKEFQINLKKTQTVLFTMSRTIEIVNIATL